MDGHGRSDLQYLAPVSDQIMSPVQSGTPKAPADQSLAKGTEWKTRLNAARIT